MNTEMLDAVLFLLVLVNILFLHRRVAKLEKRAYPPPLPRPTTDGEGRKEKNVKPSDFKKHPYDSILQHNESEVVARNIMIILSRTGDTWRELPYEEYKQERMKDGAYTGHELYEFEAVKGYCLSEQTARLFSPAWR